MHSDLDIDSKKKMSVLRTYVNDMIAVERDVFNAVSGQLKDDRIQNHPDLRRLIEKVASESEWRLKNNESMSEQLEGKWGAVLKEAVAATTGALAGVYGMVRQHPMSRMLRDDHVALNLCATAYGMLYTTAVAYGEETVAVHALEHLKSIPKRVLQITQLLPGIVVEELSEDADVNLDAVEVANLAITSAWQNAEEQEDLA